MLQSLTLSTDSQYVLMVLGLFVLSRALERFRIPSAVTAVGLGVFMGLYLHAFKGDTVVPLLSTFGIVALFLFAGLEVDFSDIRKNLRIVLEHLALQGLLLAAGAWFFGKILEVEARAAILISLALLTPSTGFILDSLDKFGLNEKEKFWVRTKAISSEIVALALLFLTIQSTSVKSLASSSLALLALIVLLPLIFRAFVKWVLPHAPKSEFSFIIITALLSALLTKNLGVYYLVGAFVVGIVAVRLRRILPAIGSRKLQDAVEFFAMFFIPFYFFQAGLHLQREDFSWASLFIGVTFATLVVPLRIAYVALHRRVSLGVPMSDGLRVGLSLVPTLVFTVVIAEILRDRFGLAPELHGALIIFALINTMLPGIILRAPPVEFDTPEFHDDDSVRFHL